MQKAIGIDFGGTSVKIGLVDETGRILDETRFATSDTPPAQNGSHSFQAKFLLTHQKAVNRPASA
jgi:predicted NBD/HSP70 family sugar kinase